MGEARKFLQKLQVTKDTNKLLEEMKTPIAITDSGDGMYIPNHSGEHDAGTTGTPTEESDLVNKDYVDSQATRQSVELFLTENSSDIGTYLDLEIDVVTAAKENIVQSITAGGTTLIASFASILNEEEINALEILESGIYNYHAHAEGQSANNLFIYFEFYHRTAGGTETLLGTSHDSGELTTSEADYDLHAIIGSEQAFVSGDRIVVKVYGRNNGAPARNVTIYMEGDTAARVEFPGLLNVQTTLWNRAGTVLSPKTAGDSIETSGAGVFEGLTPYTSAASDLGSVGFKWRSLFLSENITMTGNITVGGTVDGIDIATDVAANTAAKHTQNTDTALGSGAVAADHGTAATDQIINVSYGTGAAPTANTTTIGSLYITYTA